MNWERVEKFAEDFFSALGHCVAEDEEGSLDFFAVYLIPADAWYIIPYDALGKRLTVHFVPGGRRQKYAQYREAWHLLEGKKNIEIFACADEAFRDDPGVFVFAGSKS